MIKQKKLATLEKDLIKSNLNYTSISYFSALILTTILSVIIALFIVLFFLFFNITPDLPIVTKATEQFSIRLLKVFWIIFVAPLITFLFMYLYPSLERKAVESKINIELPFAAIHMAAISGSLIEPIKVFSIISSTKEYPNLEREFNKLLNEINIYGYDIVTALKNLAINCPSSKLAELFNGLATTITSGGDLYDFFDKRSQTLLFEYKLDKEKRTKSAETFMDIYISVVIAAPMILMLLLMMMKVSGLGIGLSTPTLTFLIVGGVALINIFFLIFLQLKQPETT
jgi:flagellar protein FlaJ